MRSSRTNFATPIGDRNAMAFRASDTDNFRKLTLAGQLASNRAPSGPVDSTQLAMHLQKLLAEDDMRAGENPNLLIFTPNERREIACNSRLTPVQARFPRLPMADALAGSDAANGKREGRTQPGIPPQEKSLHAETAQRRPRHASQGQDLSSARANVSRISVKNNSANHQRGSRKRAAFLFGNSFSDRNRRLRNSDRRSLAVFLVRLPEMNARRLSV